MIRFSNVLGARGALGSGGGVCAVRPDEAASTASMIVVYLVFMMVLLLRNSFDIRVGTCFEQGHGLKRFGGSYGERMFDREQ